MKKLRMLSGILAVILALLACSGACADLKRGSKGDNVKELQQMMIDLGILGGEADGIYGKKTEASVKKLQKYWGKKQNGRANDEFLLELNNLWHLALGNGTESGADAADLENPVLTCAHNENAPYGFDYCYRHEEGKALRDLLNPGKGRKVPDGLKKAVLKRMKEYWLEAIRLTYDEWEKTLPDEKQHIAQEQKELFERGWAEKEPELAQANGGAEKIRTLEAQVEWLEALGIEGCFDLHGAEPNPG